MALTKAGTIFESRRKTTPFHGYNDVGSRHPFATKRPILADLNCGINDGSSFCGAHLFQKGRVLAQDGVHRLKKSSGS